MITLPAAYIISKPGVHDKIGFLLPEGYRDAVWALVRSVPSQQLTVKLDKPRKPRSTGWRSQNHHANGHVQQICEETGNDFGQVKLYVKRQAMRRGLPAMTDENGQIVYSVIDKEPLPMSESDMNAEQCGWFIEECHVLAAELGIKLKENKE